LKGQEGFLRKVTSEPGHGVRKGAGPCSKEKPWAGTRTLKKRALGLWCKNGLLVVVMVLLFVRSSGVISLNHSQI
jgi:hypothetical protein